MTQDEHQIQHNYDLHLRLTHLEEVMELHRSYQQQNVDRAYQDLNSRLHEMNRFREENREMTSQFCTNQMVDTKVNQLHDKMEAFEMRVNEGIGKRVNTLEMYRANMDGRLWIWGALIVVLTLFLQFYPVMRGKF